MNTYNDLHEHFSIGLSTHLLNGIYAKQDMPNWCWAACIEMYLKLSGLPVSQRYFAAQTCGYDQFGRIKDCPATFEVITSHLNNCYSWGTQYKYCLKTDITYGAPNLFNLYNTLIQGKPVVIAYRRPDVPIGHAVLITGMEGYFQDGLMYVTKLVVRDPAPTLENILLGGRKEIITVRSFLSTIQAHWEINLQLQPIYDFSSWTGYNWNLI